MDWISPGKRYRYSIEIIDPIEEGLCDASNGTEGYSVMYSKNYGNMQGGSFSCDCIEELIDSLKRIIRDWEEYDTILGRIPDKVTEKNLYFASFTSKISTSDVIGIQTLRRWVR